MSRLASDVQQIPIGSLPTLSSTVLDLQTQPVGPAPVIVQDDLVMAGQSAKQPDEDSNRVAQQLAIGRIGDGTFHGRGIDSNLASPFQPLAVGPLHQQPVDLLPGAGLDAADVLLKAGGTGSPAKRKTSEPAIALRVVQEERQLGVGQLLPLFEDGPRAGPAPQRAREPPDWSCRCHTDRIKPDPGSRGCHPRSWERLSVPGRVGDRARARKAEDGVAVFDALLKLSLFVKVVWFLLFGTNRLTNDCDKTGA